MTDKNKTPVEETGTVKALMPTESTSVNEMFTKVLTARLEFGALEEILSEKVDFMINQTINSLFSSHGEIGRALSEKVKSSILPEIERMDEFPSYHDYVMKTIKASTERFGLEHLQPLIEKQVDKVMDVESKNYKLSTLIQLLAEDIGKDKFGDDDEDQYDEYGDEIHREVTVSLHIDKESVSSFKYIYLGVEDMDTMRKCKYRIGLYHGEVFTCQIDGDEFSSARSLKPYRGFDEVLVKIYALRGSIEFDEGLEADSYELCINV